MKHFFYHVIFGERSGSWAGAFLFEQGERAGPSA